MAQMTQMGARELPLPSGEEAFRLLPFVARLVYR